MCFLSSSSSDEARGDEQHGRRMIVSLGDIMQFDARIYIREHYAIIIIEIFFSTENIKMLFQSSHSILYCNHAGFPVSHASITSIALNVTLLSRQLP